MGKRRRAHKVYVNYWKNKYFPQLIEMVNNEIFTILENSELFYKESKVCKPIDDHFLKFLDNKNFRLEANSGIRYKTDDSVKPALLRSFIHKKAVVFTNQTIEKTIDEVTLEGVQPRSDIKKAALNLISKHLDEWIANSYPYYNEIISHIKKNPLYCNLQFFTDREQFLSCIPDDVTTLFPKARRIRRHFILHIGDTNTGKTYEAMQELAAARSGAYFAPLRLLALEGQEKLLGMGINCSMMTGEEADIREDATHICCTMEMVDTDKYYDVVVIDEAQMIGDKDRGYAWTKGILGCYSPQIHVCMSENAENLIVKMIESCEDTYEVKYHERNTSLIFEDTQYKFPKDIREGDAFIVFSRKSVLALSVELESYGWKPSVIYGSLPYSVRKEEMRRFMEGETNVIVATDAIGMGVNIPIRRIVFMAAEKFDGTCQRPLNMSEIKQISGRAGRKGLFDEGFVNTIEDRKRIRAKLFEPYRNLKYARLQLPETLFSLPMKLSEMLKIWNKTEDKDFYKKTVNDEKIADCEWMEKYFPNFSKEAMWTIACVAFDRKDEELFRIRNMIVKNIYENVRIDSSFVFEEIDNKRLDACELYYKKLDLYYSFTRIFGNSYPEFQKALTEEKEKTSVRIIQLLKENGKQEYGRRCKYCGRPLPFSFGYGICTNCYNNRFNYDFLFDDDIF